MEVQGKLVRSPHKTQNMELQAETIRVVGPCDTWVCRCSRSPTGRSALGINFKRSSIQQNMVPAGFSLNLSGSAGFDLSVVSIGYIEGEPWDHHESSLLGQSYVYLEIWTRTGS